MNTSAQIYGSVHSLGGDATVNANEHLNVFSLAGAASGGVAAIGAGITIMTIGENVDAGIQAGAAVSATGTVGVHSELDENVTDIAGHRRAGPGCGHRPDRCPQRQ